MSRPANSTLRKHMTTTLPLDLAEALEDYVRANKVHKNQVVELAIKAFLLKEQKRQGSANG